MLSPINRYCVPLRAGNILLVLVVSQPFRLGRPGSAMSRRYVEGHSMKLSTYFKRAKGIGVLATADKKGRVNAAIYARPHFPDSNDDNLVAFIMGDRASHDNVTANPSAVYLFVEQTEGYKGKRLTLTRLKEETDPELVRKYSRRLPPECEDGKTRYLVYFRVDAVRPLIGAE
jgi:hypothetical protein